MLKFSIPTKEAIFERELEPKIHQLYTNRLLSIESVQIAATTLVHKYPNIKEKMSRKTDFGRKYARHLLYRLGWKWDVKTGRYLPLKGTSKKNQVLKVLDFEQPAVETLISIEDNLVKIEPIEDEITIIEVLGKGLKNI